MDHGFYTGEMGKRLYEKYAESVHQVYYDHGKDQNREPHLCRPTPFFGQYSRATTLSYVDIVVVNQHKQNIELAAEIEESGHEPKQIIGDVVNLLMADSVRINGRDYPFGNWVLILGIRVDERGGGKDKLLALCQRLTQLNETSGKRNTQIVPVFHSEVEHLVEEVATEIDRRLAAP